MLNLITQTRRETVPGSEKFHPVTAEVVWNPAQTAVVLCDIWDKHWCPSATARVGELVPAINATLRAVRDQGVLIIHSPSETMDFYAGTPERRRAQEATPSKTDTEIPGYRAPNEPPLPIDDSDGGCMDADAPFYRAWSRQHPGIDILPGDGLSDSGQEIVNLLEQENRENILLIGIHTNMCVLNRPFAIRRLLALGKEVVFVRDVTDAMYNPARPPYVSHFEGTRRVVAHIETYLCPTIESSDLTGLAPFRFKGDE